MSNPTVGIIGAGNIGSDIAQMALAAQLPIVISNSRGPSTLSDLVEKLGKGATADTAEAAARRADIVVIAAPLASYATLPSHAFDGKIVIDATNYLPDMFGRLTELEESNLTSSEFLQQQWPGARLVKALNNVDFVRLPQLPRPADDVERSALPVASNDTEAKATVIDFLNTIGFDALDMGNLSESWRSQPGSPLYVMPYFRDADPAPEDPGARFFTSIPVPVPLEHARELLAAATNS